MIIHIIQRGATLWNIAERYGISLSEIIAANSLPDPNRLLIGQSLVIPIAFRQYRPSRGNIMANCPKIWSCRRVYCSG